MFVQLALLLLPISFWKYLIPYAFLFLLFSAYWVYMSADPSSLFWCPWYPPWALVCVYWVHIVYLPAFWFLFAMLMTVVSFSLVSSVFYITLFCIFRGGDYWISCHKNDFIHICFLFLFFFLLPHETVLRMLLFFSGARGRALHLYYWK